MASSVSGTSSSVTRTYGLSGSGMDVDSMVEKLMTAARQPYTKLEQKQTILGWKKEAYNTLATSIDTFRNQKVFNFQMKSNLAPKTVTSSNSSAVSVTATGDAANVNHSITVTQLATGATQSSTAKITTGTSKASLATQFGVSGSFSLMLNGKQITVSSTQSINDVVNSINKSGAGVTAIYDTAQDRFYLYTNSTGADSAIDFTGTGSQGLSFLTDNLKISAFSNIDSNNGITSGTSIGVTDANTTLADAFMGFSGSAVFQFSNGTSTATIQADDTDTIQDLIDKINAAQDSSGKKMAVATFVDGKFTIKAKNSGEVLDFSGSSAGGNSFLVNRLKLTKQQGQDAQFKLDNVTMTQSTNKVTVANVTYNLLATGSSTVSIANDIDKIISNVKTFIDDYNTLLSSINTKVNEDYDSDYQPLSDDQKKAMSDDDISAWTTKAKTGLLHNDSILKPMAEAMRNAFSSAVSGITGKYTSAASIGIATGVDWTENGKLYVDEDKLRTALKEDPDVVYKIFGTTGTTTNSNGIAVRLGTILKDASSKIVDEAGVSTKSTLTNDITSVLGKQNKELTTKMTALNKKLVMKENQYYSQFNAMEQALSKLSQQSSYLSSLLGSNS